jgi:cytochrome P450
MEKLPKGPPPAEEEELLKAFPSNPFLVLKTCYEKYGEMFTLNLGTFGIKDYNASGAWVFLCNSEHIKILFKPEDKDAFSGAQGNDIQFQQLLPKGATLLLDGDEHRQRRKMMSPTVQSNEKIRQLTDSMVNIASNEIKEFPLNRQFTLIPRFRQISSEIMRNLIFGDINKEDATSINVKLGKFPEPQNTRDEKLALFAESGEILDKIMGEYRACPHLAGESKNSIFNVLMAANSKQDINDHDINGEILVLMFAGLDTIASAMSWITAWILSNPEVEEKVRQELQQAFSDNRLTSENFDKLTYLEAVISESSRISQMFFSTSVRLLQKSFTLGEYELPAGTMVATCVPVVHSREDYYPEPNVFKPERFLNKKLDNTQFLLYGGGVRRCLGAALAEYEMKVVIATLFLQCQFEPVDVSTEAELQGAFFAPKGSVMVKLKSAEQ